MVHDFFEAVINAKWHANGPPPSLLCPSMINSFVLARPAASIVNICAGPIPVAKCCLFAGKQIHSERDFWRFVSQFFSEKRGGIFWRFKFAGSRDDPFFWGVICPATNDSTSSVGFPAWGALCASHGKHWIARKAPILNHKTTGAHTLHSLWKSRGSQRMTTRLKRREGSPC